MFGLTPSIVVFLVLAIICGVIANLLTEAEIGAIDQRLPEKEQLSYFGYPGKISRMIKAYRRLYPSGLINLWRITGPY